MTSHSWAVDRKLRPAAATSNRVSPVGTGEPLSYLDTKLKLALPVSAVRARTAPTGEVIQPPPVRKPPVGS